MARLHDENVRAANVFENLKINLAVAESPEQRFAQRHIQVAADALRQYRIRGPRENLKSVVVHDARAPCDHSAATPLGMQPNRKGLLQWDGHEETLRQNPRHASRLLCDAHQTSVPVARDSLANEGLVVRKPNSGSARHRWARENSKHRRTATCQRGFCSPSWEQFPLDLIKPGMSPENRSLEIIRKAASLLAPA